MLSDPALKKIVGGGRADTIVNHPSVIELRQRAGLAAVVIEFEKSRCFTAGLF